MFTDFLVLDTRQNAKLHQQRMKVRHLVMHLAVGLEKSVQSLICQWM